MKSEKVYAEYLLIRAQAGEAAAVEDLMVLLLPKVKAFVLKLIGGAAVVDDCVQESLLKIFQRINHIKQPKAMHTWIYRVVHTTCIDAIRKIEIPTEQASDTSEAINDYEQQLDIKSAIATLSELHQAVVFLFYYEGFKVAEMAEILDKPAGTIKSMLFDARDLIKSKLSVN